MKNKKIIYCILGVIGITALWFLVFNVRSMQIDSEIESMSQVDNLVDNYTLKTITDIKAVVKGVNIELHELENLEEVPVTLGVVVTYDDGSVVEKSAYISYTDVSIPEYIDNEYGRILLPDSWYKE